MLACVAVQVLSVTLVGASLPVNPVSDNFVRLVNSVESIAAGLSSCETSESVLALRDALQGRHDEYHRKDVEQVTAQLQELRDRIEDPKMQPMNTLRQASEECDTKLRQLDSLLQVRLEQLEESAVARAVEQCNAKLERQNELVQAELKILQTAVKDQIAEALVEVGREQREQLEELQDKLQNSLDLANTVRDDLTQIDLRVGDLEGNTTAEIRSFKASLLQLVNELQLSIRCRPPYSLIAGECLYIVLDKTLPWAEARGFCQESGGDLATPADPLATRAHLKELGTGSNMWIGASDLSTEGEWLWTTGEGAWFTLLPAWGDKEPNGGTRENCAHFYPARDMYINDSNCINAFSFVCQMKGSSVA